ncbi:MAG: pinensin family lanthipeptide [Rhodothermaceae bacterium]
MKKIKLDLNQLKVNSFEISARTEKTGTVKGFVDTEIEICILSKNPGCDSRVTCEMNSCFLACQYTCYVPECDF